MGDRGGASTTLTPDSLAAANDPTSVNAKVHGLEASITGAINPRDKPMIGRWDQLGFIHSDETMSCARTIFTNC